MDSSGSVGRLNFVKQLNFVTAVVEELEIGPEQTQIAMTSFSTRARTAFYLNSYATKKEVVMAIYDVPYR